MELQAQISTLQTQIVQRQRMINILTKSRGRENKSCVVIVKIFKYNL